jgi:hypothetical protein
MNVHTKMNHICADCINYYPVQREKEEIKFTEETEQVKSSVCRY